VVNLLYVKFLHVQFTLKVIKNINKTIYVYIQLQKKNYFFFLSGCIHLTPKVIQPKWTYNISFKIPDKITLNLIFLDILSAINSLKQVISVKAQKSCTKQTKYTLLRSSFVHKNSREQLSISYHTLRFSLNFATNNYLVVDYIQLYFYLILKILYVFNIKKTKKITLKE
jgi:ribosomal protein S10